MKIQIIREKNNLIWLFHKNLKINAVLENVFKCKIRHGFFSVKTFTEIIILFQQSSCLVGFFKIAWVLIVKVCVEV